jgi:LmbE family N-acetylglucosaminyl deacetylase
VADLLTAAPVSALAIYAHPDDPDVSCGGTLARWAAAGCEVHVCICADGDKGSADPKVATAELVGRRREEVSAAGVVLGVGHHHWLGFADGEIDDGSELRSRLVGLIRAVRPAIVVGVDPTAVYFGSHYINHRDHRVVGWATLDAVAPAAGNPRYFPDAGPAYHVETLLLSGTLSPDSWVDIGATIDAKAQAVACHRTQVGDSVEWLRTVVRQRAEDAGREAGVQYAEGYRRLVFA